MTIKEAERIAREFESKTKKTESDVLLFTEAMEYLIRVGQDPGGYDVAGRILLCDTKL
jgi:hypothetical protein